MEEVYKKGSRYFSMQTGRELSAEHVEQVGPFYWHCHGIGMPVVEVAEYEENTRRDAETYKDDVGPSGGYKEED